MRHSSEPESPEAWMRLSEKRMRAFFAATEDSVILLDSRGTIIALNEVAASRRGKRAADLKGKCIYHYYSPSILEKRKHKIQKSIRTGCPEFFEEQNAGKHYRISLYPILDASGKTNQLVSVSRDITRHRYLEEQHRGVVFNAPIGIYRSTPQPRGRYLNVNPWFAQLFGYSSPRELMDAISDIGRQLYVDPTRREDLHNQLLEHGAAEDFEAEMLRKDGSRFWAHRNVRAVRDETGSIRYCEGFVTDVTQRKVAETRLTRLAYHDDLTGLPNRAQFTSLLEETIANAARHPLRRYGVLFFDLDDFKLINDSFGHHQGDRLLQFCAARLGDAIGASFTLARFGGDEFAALLDDVVDQFAIIRAAEAIHAALRPPFNLKGYDIKISACIGVVFGTQAHMSSGQVLRDADIAMYRAKALGKGRTEIFDNNMHAEVVERVRLEQDLRTGVDRDEFYLVYQPIFSLANNSLAGFEALVRWRHPEREVVSPAAFIPILEETGLIISLGERILNQACRQMAEWSRRCALPPGLAVNVNISGKQLFQSDVAELVKDSLRRHDLHPERLKVELTESVLMEDMELAAEIIDLLRGFGVRTALDDFGTGYSSLGYLRKLPLDVIKIDRSFVSRMENDDRSSRIVKIIIDLAHTLDMSVVAEGVETEGALLALSSMRCDCCQGYYFSPPVPAHEAEAILQRNL